jgi:phosphate transport system permease protein
MNRMWKEHAVKYALMGAASVSIVIVALIFLFLGKEAAPFASDPGLSELADSRWLPVSGIEGNERYGLLPLIAGSVLVTLLATAIAVPFGVLGAVYISEVAQPREREILKPFVEVLAGIPSVVLGFFGLMVVVPAVQKVFGLSSGLTALSGAIMLAFMAVPTIISVSEDAIRSVPRSYRTAALALGASRLETVWKVTIPAALSGITAAVMLGMGRVVGETMAVMMLTGNSPLTTANPFSSVCTMTATIAGEMGEVAFGSVHYAALFCIGIVLLLMTFGLNVVARRVLRKHRMA